MIVLLWQGSITGDQDGEAMKSANLRRRCRNRLDEMRARGFEVPKPLDAAELCRRTSACLDQPITLVGVEMPTGAPFGLTFFTDAGLVIAYEERTSELHQNLIVAHEIGHAMFGHGTAVVDDAEASQLLLPSLRPSLVNRVLARTGAYDRVAEQEAEMIATLLLEEASRADPSDDPVLLDPESAEVYERLRSTFEHPDR